MIELIAENRACLDLPDNIEISIVDENPMFMEDRIPAPYSLDFEVPTTLRNLEFFGFPTRLASAQVKRKVPAELRFYSTVIGRGEVLLLENEKTLKLQFKGSLEHENINKDLNQLDLGEKDYGTVPNFKIDPFVQYNSLAFTNYKNGLYQQAVNPSDFVIAPVKLKGVDDWEAMPDFQGIKNAYRQYINYWSTQGGLQFSEYWHIQNKYHTPVLPFPYLWKVIEQGFGGQLVNNPFATGDLKKLILVAQTHKYFDISSYFKTTYSLPLLDHYAASGDEQLKFAVKSFQQAYAFKSFLKNILKIFSMTAFPGNKYSLEFNNDIFDRNIVTKLDDKLTGNLQVNYEDARDYRFQYADYGESDVEHNDTSFTTSQMFGLFHNLNQSFEGTFTDNNFKSVFHWKAEMVGANSQLEITSEILRSALAIQKTGSNRERYEVSSEVSPLDMNLHKTWIQYQNPVTKRHWFVPELEKQSNAASPHIMFHGGMAQTFEQDGQYPYLMAHHTDHFGVQRLNTSLHPEGNGGLLQKFHGKFSQWVEKDKKKVRGLFKLTPLEIKNLNIRDKIHLKGRLFYILKKEYSIKHKGVSLVDIELIEI